MLYDEHSTTQLGTLSYARQKYVRKNVTSKKLWTSTNQGSEFLFVNLGKTNIVAALMELFGMEDFEDIPTKNVSNRKNKKGY